MSKINRITSIGNTIEDNSLEIEVRIKEIDNEFKALIASVTADMVDGFDQNKIGELMREKQELQKKFQEIRESKERAEEVNSRLSDIYTVMDGLKNRPLVYDDSIIRKMMECIVVESKEKIRLVFIGGMERSERIVDKHMI